MDDSLQIAGLPLHPLLVHAVVVLAPLTVLAVLLAQFWPAARRRIGVVAPLAALVLLILVPITVRAGEALKRIVGPLPAVETHEGYGRMLLPWVIALFVVALSQWAWFRWGAGRAARTPRRVVAVVLAIAAVAVAAGTVVVIVLIGDSGARAVWGGLV